MKRIFALIALICGVAVGQIDNTTGYLDTTGCYACSSTVAWFGKPYRLAAFENMRISVRAADTSVAGYASDSVAGKWGYQTFHLGQTTSTSTDTIFDEPVLVDSFKMTTSANLRNFSSGTAVFGSYDSTGALARHWLLIDTTGFASWATQSRNIQPEWDVYIRPFWVGLADNRKAGKIKGPLFQFVRSIGQNSRVK